MRRQAVAFCLIDSAFPSDAKFRKLARRLPAPDDFNSAVGAYFIALAAARRNGLPALDLEAETESSFIGVLVEVGLLTPDGFPEAAFRAWAPARPKRPSESSASNASNVSNTSEVRSERRLPSPPLYSTPEERNAREGLPHITASIIGAWETATGLSVLGSGAFAQDYLDDAARRHPETRVLEAIVAARARFNHVPSAQALAAKVRQLLDPLPSASKDDGRAERELEERRASERRELATLRRNHEVGGHEDTASPRCPLCREGAA